LHHCRPELWRSAVWRLAVDDSHAEDCRRQGAGFRVKTLPVNDGELRHVGVDAMLMLSDNASSSTKPQAAAL